MCQEPPKGAFEQVCRRFRSAGSFLIVTHARPDGDGLGSMAALARSARAAGKKAVALVPDAVPPRYAFLFADSPPGEAAQFDALADEADLIVIVDTCALAQLDGLQLSLASRREKIVTIDHHATADDVGAVQWQDTSAAAAGVMAAELIEALGWPVDLATAEALTTAVATDTGWARFANTDGRSLRALADWVDAGVRPDRLYKRLYQCDRPERLRLMTRMLDSLELFCGGRLAVMVIRRSDFQAAGARDDETENLINEALRIGTVETAVLLVEMAGFTRVSLRSRDAVDVSAIAARLGGGGHARAAGIRAEQGVDALRERLVEWCSRALGAAERRGSEGECG